MFNVNQLTPQEPVNTEEVDKTPEEGEKSEEGTETETEETENVGNQDGGDDGDVPVIDQLKGIYGVDGTFENSVDGLQQLVTQVTDKAKADGINEVFTQKPVLKQLNDHLEAGKSLDTFFQVQQVKSDKIEVPALSGDEVEQAQLKAQYKDVIRIVNTQLGLNEKQINRIIEAAELEDTLYDDAKELADLYNAKQEEKAAAIDAAEAKRIEDEKAAGEKTIADIKSIIASGKIGAATIPQTERAEFEKFVLEVGKDGMTERDRKIASLTTEKWLLIDYLIKKDFNIKGLNLTAAKGSLEQLRTKTANDRMNGGGPQVQGNLPNFDFGNLK